MASIEMLGLLAGAINICSFIPQIIKSYRTKETRDLSLLTFVSLFVGTVLWLIYGVAINRAAVYITNGVFLCLLAIIVLQELHYNKRKQ